VPDLGFVTKLAQAVADGQPPDWEAALSSATDPVERGTIAELRAVHGIHGLMTTWMGRRCDDAARTALAPGDNWGSLEVRAHIGRGRFGDVYLAWDPALERNVALKIIRHGDSPDGAETRVVEEGRLMARVRHPNVVTIYGAQRTEGVSGLWMEFVEGRTLAAELAERGPFESAELIRLGADLARALGAVHRAGLVHRDVKAQNVLREASGRVVLGDFGTGLDLEEPDEARGGLAGTPAYLAPEIFEGKAATPRSDQYSLGALLFHLATGRHAVPGRSVRELRDAHVRGVRHSIHALRPDLPELLRHIIERALDPDSAARFESGMAMAAALEKVPAPRHSKTRRAQLVVLAAGLAAAVGAAVYALGRSGPDETASAPPLQSKLILVTEFENRTSDAPLAATLGPSVARGLSGSSVFGVVPAARVHETLALMRRPANTRQDLEVAREVALRDADVVALVSGRIESVGDVFAIRLEVRAAGDGAQLASVVGSEVPHGAVVETVRRLAVDLRRQLDTSVRLPEPSPPLPRVTTSSLRALQLYAEVLALRDGEGLLIDREHDAERLLRAATADDPEFAAAHVMLAIVVRLAGDRAGQSRLDEALVHAERAIAYSSDISRFEQIRAEEQRHFIRFLMNPPEPEASAHSRALLAGCEELLQLRPDDANTLIGCVNFYQLTGTPNPEVAIRLADLRPETARWQMAAAQEILAAQPDQIERARYYVQRAARLEPVGQPQAANVARAHLFAAREAWLANRPHEALRISEDLRRRMATLPSPERRAFAQALWLMYLDLGQLERAAAVAAEIAPWSNRRNSEVIIAVAGEDRHALRALLARYFPKIEDAGGVASAFIEAGLLEQSRGLIEAHRRLEATRPGQFSQYLLMLEGHLALVEGRAGDAIVRFERFLANHGSRPRTGRWRRVQRLLADALVAKGDLTRALTALESASTRPEALAASDQDWLLARERLATLYSRLGRTREAASVENDLRTAMAVADAGYPIKRRLDAASTVPAR
jgi:hypothetical protein